MDQSISTGFESYIGLAPPLNLCCLAGQLKDADIPVTIDKPTR